MNETVDYFHLRTNTMDPSYQQKSAHADAMRTTLCTGCAFPRPNAGAIDVWLQEERAPRDKPLNFLCGCGIGLIHQELLEMLVGVDIDRDLFLGRVFNRHDRECLEWRSFHGRHTVTVRGSKEAEHHRCEVCGRSIYFARGKRYLYPAPSTDATILCTDEAGLLVHAEIAARVKIRKWRKMKVERLPIPAVPPDGFGLLPYREAQT